MSKFFTALLAVVLLATPAAAQQQQQQFENVTSEKSGDWTVECGTVPQTKQRVCRMAQIINDPTTNKPAAQAMVLKGQQGGKPAAVLRVVAPLALWLRPGIGISVDGGANTTMQFEVCLRDGCMAQLPLSTGLVNALKRGSAAQLALQHINRRKVNLNMSLRGFTTAYDKL